MFAFDDQGRVVREVNAENGDEIEWEVHVANTKGAWYQLNSPMDMGAQTPGLTGQMRNQGIAGEKREHLVIDPGAKKLLAYLKAVLSWLMNFGRHLTKLAFI